MGIQDKLKPLQEEYNKYMHLYNEVFIKMEELLKEDIGKFNTFLLDLNISVLPNTFIHQGGEIKKETVIKMFKEYKDEQH